MGKSADRRGRGFGLTRWGLALAFVIGSFGRALATTEVAARAVPGHASNAVERAASLPTQQVLHRTLRSDPEQEYWLYVPSTGGLGAPVFVSVHGISRNAEEHARLFAPFAERYGVVLLAPFFTPELHDDYQRLGRAGRGRAADLALDAIVDEVTGLTAASAGKIHLFGYSGGAQFAHRYAMAHPDRVANAVIGAAGWYTFPDARVTYPYGIGASPELPRVRFDPQAFLRVPITVLVGADDRGSENLRRNPEVDRQQGTTRVERAENWVEAMRAAAQAQGLPPLVSVESVPGIHHSFRQFMEEGALGDKVFRALFGAPARRPAADASRIRREDPRGSAVPNHAPALALVLLGGMP